MRIIDELKKANEARKALLRFKDKLRTCKRTDEFIEAFAEYRGVQPKEARFFKERIVSSLKKEGLYKKRISKHTFIQYVNRKFNSEEVKDND